MAPTLCARTPSSPSGKTLSSTAYTMEGWATNPESDVGSRLLKGEHNSGKERGVGKN
jgi:hypothetical protein